LLYVAYQYDETPTIIAEFFCLNYTTTGAGSIFNRKLTTESATETLHFMYEYVIFYSWGRCCWRSLIATECLVGKRETFTWQRRHIEVVNDDNWKLQCSIESKESMASQKRLL